LTVTEIKLLGIVVAALLTGWMPFLSANQQCTALKDDGLEQMLTKLLKTEKKHKTLTYQKLVVTLQLPNYKLFTSVKMQQCTQDYTADAHLQCALLLVQNNNYIDCNWRCVIN